MPGVAELRANRRWWLSRQLGDLLARQPVVEQGCDGALPFGQSSKQPKDPLLFLTKDLEVRMGGWLDGPAKRHLAVSLLMGQPPEVTDRRVCSREPIFFFISVFVEIPCTEETTMSHFPAEPANGRSSIMQAVRRSQRDLSAARSMFSSAAVTIGSLYLATHSVAVTLIGAATSTVLTCCAIWLPNKPKHALDSANQSAPGHDDTRDPVASRDVANG